ncbi:hypothetical protein AIOL_000532 [Candidatus Rhodobacter oscarellae]|uniref:Uncharacterized protein n=1 Tax=Candidatus Rhodobacter oscarellae TaxID=1675527 RepID=A0A0J9EFC4_9RHOB|nr:hypothetical protein [Candidatus Rhodobacter lobularis]KMW60379.1 hypothetical protein AIOL_000532 [Candidatus Rhodobacter lobularis]
MAVAARHQVTRGACSHAPPIKTPTNPDPAARLDPYGKIPGIKFSANRVSKAEAIAAE